MEKYAKINQSRRLGEKMEYNSIEKLFDMRKFPLDHHACFELVRANLRFLFGSFYYLLWIVVWNDMKVGG